jgi:putative ABC transport system permease protein
MVKNKLFIFINISGLSIAIGCCLVAYYLHDFNATFDANHSKIGSIYRVSSLREFQGKVNKYGHSPMPLGNVIRQNIPDVEKVVRYASGQLNLRVGTNLFMDEVAHTDPSFFEVFTFETAKGNLSIKDKSSILLSEELAYKYFANEDPIGKTVSQMSTNGNVKDFMVVGVFKKQPNNSSFIKQAYIHFDNQFAPGIKITENSWEARATLFIQVSNSKNVTSITNHLQQYIENNNRVREDFLLKGYLLDPFEGLAKKDSYANIRGVWTNAAAHISAIVGTAMMGVFILLIACFNLTNTSIAISSSRLKELGIRKVMGSSRKHIIVQFIGETWMICFISLLIGCAVAYSFLIPAFNSLWPFWSFTPDYLGKPDFFIFIFFVLFITSILVGSYPALYISKFQPVTILKGSVALGGTNGFTRTLLTTQLMISLIAVICSIAFIDNAKYQKSLDLGFNKNEVIYAQIENTGEYEAIRNRLLQNKDITSIAGSHHHINSSYFSDPIKHEGKEIEVDILDVGDDYVKTAGITLLEGRDFETNSATDKKESVLITENMASTFGWDKPIGKRISWNDTTYYFVIGVVKNIVNKGLMNHMDPVMLRYQVKQENKYILVTAPLKKISTVKAETELITKELFPDKIITFNYMNELVVNSANINNSILKMFVFLGIVALLLSATGLYTLVSLNVAKRMKEIGVRKVLGASGGSIARVINKEFAIILCLSAVLGSFAGSSLAGLLLDSIWEHFQHITALTIVFSIVILCVTAVLAIGYKVYSTIRINPTVVLRSE